MNNTTTMNNEFNNVLSINANNEANISNMTSREGTRTQNLRRTQLAPVVTPISIEVETFSPPIITAWERDLSRISNDTTLVVDSPTLVIPISIPSNIPIPSKFNLVSSVESRIEIVTLRVASKNIEVVEQTFNIDTPPFGAIDILEVSEFEDEIIYNVPQADQVDLHDQFIESVIQYGYAHTVLYKAPSVCRAFEYEDLIKVKLFNTNIVDDCFATLISSKRTSNLSERYCLAAGARVATQRYNVINVVISRDATYIPSIIHPKITLSDVLLARENLIGVYEKQQTTLYDRASNYFFELVYRYTRYEDAEISLFLRNIDFLSRLKYLVGIETNPGPNYDQIMRFLKNSEKISLDRASNPKREKVYSNRTTRENEKVKTLIKKNRRNFVPEGLFTAGLDDETKDFIAEMVSKLQEALSNGMNLKVDWTSNVLTTLDRVVNDIKSKSMALYDYFKFLFCAFYRICSDSGKAALSIVCDIFLGFNPEGIMDSAFLLMLYKDTIGKHFGGYDVVGIAKIISKIKYEGDTISSAVAWFLDLVKIVTVALNKWCRTSIPVFSGDCKLDDFFSQFYELKKQFENKGSSQYHVALAIYALHDEVERYFRQCENRDEREKVSYLLRVLKPVVTLCETTVNPNNGPRIEPLAMLITGPSGVGKSSFTTPILLALLSRVLPKERRAEFMKNHNDFLFFRANENQFWDGYTSRHEAIIFDDFGQKKDVAGGDNADAFEIIRLKNTAPYHLHFASIADKQKNYANPRLLYATTNRNQLTFNSIVSNEAVIRRFDIAVCQVPKAKFCKNSVNTLNPWDRRLDIDKVREAYPFSITDPSSYLALEILEFVEWDFTLGCPKDGGRVFSFDEFIDLAQAKYIDLNNKGDAMLNYHEHMKAKWMAEGGDVESQELEPISEESEQSFKECEDLSESIKTMFDSLITPQKMFGSTLQFAISVTGIVATAVSTYALISSFLARNFMGEVNVYGGPRNTKKSVQHHASKKYSRDAKRNAIKDHPREPKEYVPKQRAPAVSGRNRSARRSQAMNTARSHKQALHNGFTQESAEYGFLSKIIKRNMYVLKIDGLKIGSILFVKGSTFVYPAHYDSIIEQEFYEEVQEEEVLIADLVCPTSGKTLYQFDWNEKMLVYDFEFDLVAMKLNAGFRDHSDITKSFLPELAIKDNDRVKALLPVERDEFLSLLEPEIIFGESVEYAGCKSNKMIYYAATQAGDCGSPLITYDKRFGGPKILGFHTAGARHAFGTKMCAGVFLTSEELEMALISMEETTPYSEVYKVELGFTTEGFSALRKVPKPKLATQTKIVPSIFSGSLDPPITKPAYLREFVDPQGELVDPSCLAKQKYSTLNKYVPTELLDLASEIVNKRILRRFVPAPWEPRLHTFEEAVAGVPGVDFVNSIDRGTSAGYPLNLEGSNGKRKWLGTEGLVDFTTDGAKDLKLMVDDLLEKAKVGIRKEIIYMDCLKDERRPIAKVDQGKTRQFMACPVDYLIAVKMYFGDFIRHICQNRIHNGVSVGIDPTTEWGELYRHLQPKEDYEHGAGDYRSFDCGLSSKVSWRFLDAAELFYTSATTEDTLVRRILFHDMINSIHVDKDGHLYQFTGKNPSGQPTTSILNSYDNCLMLVSCWIENGIPLDAIDNEFRWNTFGDDHVTGFPKEYSNLAGSLALEKTMLSLFNYEYTDEGKSGTLVNTKPLMHIQYLKRGFKMVKNEVRAPLELTVILETLNWEKRTTDAENFKTRVDNVFVELANHGKETYNAYAPRFKTLSIKYLDYISPFGTFEKAYEAHSTFSE